MHWFATDMGAPGLASPLITRVLADIAIDAEATRTLLRVLNHEVRLSRLFTTPRLARAAARALRDKPEQMVATLTEIATAMREQVRRARRRRVAHGGPPNVKAMRP